jgi:hypothetical protein
MRVKESIHITFSGVDRTPDRLDIRMCRRDGGFLDADQGVMFGRCCHCDPEEQYQTTRNLIPSPLSFETSRMACLEFPRVFSKSWFKELSSMSNAPESSLRDHDHVSACATKCGQVRTHLRIRFMEYVFTCSLLAYASSSQFERYENVKLLIGKKAGRALVSTGILLSRLSSNAS